MKVIHLNHSDISGGAARATYRIHNCLNKAGVHSRMWVNKATAGDWSVEGPSTLSERIGVSLRNQFGTQFHRYFKKGESQPYSLALMPSKWVRRINQSDADVVHLHWVANEMISIADIGSIKKPIVWTLHDMWAFCGAEHYADDLRWREGYHSDNRPTHESGFDFNLWCWQRKIKHWKLPMHIVSPSHWLAACARQSVLMGDWPGKVIPNPIDTDRWKPIEQSLARKLLGLPNDKPLLMFASMGGVVDPRKGYDLLIAALQHLKKNPVAKGLELIVAGQLEPMKSPDLGFPIHFTGHLHDDLSLRAFYSAADALIVPSRLDNLPNTGVEAQACGTPVIAFDNSGLPSIVDHRTTGYLARAFDTESLARGISWVIENSNKQELRHKSRKRAEKLFAESIVAARYQEVYRQAISSKMF